MRAFISVDRFLSAQSEPGTAREALADQSSQRLVEADSPFLLSWAEISRKNDRRFFKRTDGNTPFHRRKRGISTADMADRLFVSRDTLWRLERGDPGVALGTLATAAFVLQLHDRLANLAAPATDALALTLDERRLPQRIRRPRV